ncbi:hypothetical protein [Pseudogulbenkiania subflava]|uniref:Uncharacterized protein n=1 Tax=Pseudogulbenkiania subflava DSM 22618 TaxID=1123014 RepID=A0A1Y6C4S0_9NEIS|nr:hypothetical protein [Pseudogulbenkiania subflava]SMF45662.1 hypothetical protein SAMN02745746_03376 [Pseudogulbenkiania subflava DSM 22618]
MKRMLSCLAGCLLVTSALAAGLIAPHSDAFTQCQQTTQRTAQPAPGKNNLTRDEQAKLAAHLDMLAEQTLQLDTSTANGSQAGKASHYTARRSKQAGELS